MPLFGFVLPALTMRQPVPGRIKMIPRQALEQSLRHDYKKFESMIYGEPPSFNDVLSEIEKVENLVNHEA